MLDVALGAGTEGDEQAAAKTSIVRMARFMSWIIDPRLGDVVRDAWRP
jgi:hypothetical protein